MSEHISKAWIDEKSGMFLKVNPPQGFATENTYELTYDLELAYIATSLIKLPYKMRMDYVPVSVVVKRTVEFTTKHKD